MSSVLTQSIKQSDTYIYECITLQPLMEFLLLNFSSVSTSEKRKSIIAILSNGELYERLEKRVLIDFEDRLNRVKNLKSEHNFILIGRTKINNKDKIKFKRSDIINVFSRCFN